MVNICVNTTEALVTSGWEGEQVPVTASTIFYVSNLDKISLFSA